MIIYLFLFFVVLIFLGILVVGSLIKSRKSYGILTGKKIYSDTEANPGELLYSKSLKLCGKPDYLIEDGKYIVPVEYKTTNAPSGQYTNHTMQLMAYCLLVEEHYGIRPPGGILKYEDKELKIAYTDEAKNSLKVLVTEILESKKSGKELHCTHEHHYHKS